MAPSETRAVETHNAVVSDSCQILLGQMPSTAKATGRNFSHGTRLARLEQGQHKDEKIKGKESEYQQSHLTRCLLVEVDLATLADLPSPPPPLTPDERSVELDLRKDVGARSGDPRLLVAESRPLLNALPVLADLDMGLCRPSPSWSSSVLRRSPVLLRAPWRKNHRADAVNQLRQTWYGPE